MISFKTFLEAKLAKNKWQKLLPHDHDEYHRDLIAVVDKAYGHTTLGSFVKSLMDVKGSDWEVLSQDGDEIHDTIFFRKARANETWIGHKIQGIGHDGTREGKNIVLKKLEDQLKISGWWIEASDAMARALIRRDVQPIRDEAILRTIFPSIVEIHDDGSYTRLVNGARHIEYVFGMPVLK